MSDIFECWGPDARCVVQDNLDGTFSVFKVISPHTFFNRSSEFKRDLLDTKLSREEAVFCAREHANMVLPEEYQ